jgi:hypothetical protein
MAKHRTQTSRNPLSVSLKLLVNADRESARATRLLGKAIAISVKPTALKVCEFRVGSKKYHPKITEYQCRTIKSAVSGGGDVLVVVNQLLGDLSKQIAQCIGDLTNLLGDDSKSGKGKKTGGSKQSYNNPVLGCCTYVGGQTPNLTQAQCTQYTGSTWDKNYPDCSFGRPK